MTMEKSWVVIMPVIAYSEMRLLATVSKIFNVTCFWTLYDQLYIISIAVYPVGYPLSAAKSAVQ